MLEFTMTAMRRPEIIRQTLTSFAANVRGIDLMGSILYLNVDPKPDDREDDGAIAVCREFFGAVVPNCPDESSFPAAIKWCWRQPDEEHFFHLEDDWLTTKPIDLAEMLPFLSDHSLVNLRAYPHDDQRLCLAHGLWRTADARAIAQRMRTDANPEMQLRRATPRNPHGGLHEGYRGIQFPRERKCIVLKDLGRSWMSRMGLRRAGHRQFIQWAA